MTAEEYEGSNYYYENYLKMNQWQRFRYIVRYVKKYRRIVCVYTCMHWYPLKYWRWGFDSSQEFQHLFLGPLDIGIA